jgi:PHD/YefM family antitoxin component YafN of YafNO toxin-antitoxin module
MRPATAYNAPVESRAIDLLDENAPLGEAIAECELLGRRTLLLRGGRPVAALVSFDELTALEETLALSSDPALMERIRLAGEAADRGQLCLPEDLFVE